MEDLSQTYKSVLLIFCWSIHGMRSFKKNIYIYICKYWEKNSFWIHAFRFAFWNCNLQSNECGGRAY